MHKSFPVASASPSPQMWGGDDAAGNRRPGWLLQRPGSCGRPIHFRVEICQEKLKKIGVLGDWGGGD